MGELWRDIQAEIDAQIEEQGLDQDTVDETLDATVDEDAPRRRAMLIDIGAAALTILVGLLIVHVVVAYVGAVLVLLLVLGAFTAWAALIGGADFIAGMLLGLGEFTVYGTAQLRALIRRSRPALVAAALMIGWGVAWHTSLSPRVRTRRVVSRAVEALDRMRDAGLELPQDAIEPALGIGADDPHDLARFAREGRLVDAWGRALVYRRGDGGRYQLYSMGPNGMDDLGKRDDLGRVEDLPGAGPRSERAAHLAHEATQEQGPR